MDLINDLSSALLIPVCCCVIGFLGTRSPVLLKVVIFDDNSPACLWTTLSQYSSPELFNVKASDYTTGKAGEYSNLC